MGRAVGHGLGWLEFFEELPEPRQKAKVLYPLPELLLCCLVGVLCGAEGWVEVEEYGEAKLAFLRRFLPFEHGIASHDTFSDVFNALDPEGFKAAFIAWTMALQENIREIVAVKPAPAKAGGKTLRRSFDRGAGQGPIHMISAWAAGQRLVLGQLAVDAKDNEITAIPELLALLSLKGAIVTIDAACPGEGRGLPEENRRRHSRARRRLCAGAQEPAPAKAGENQPTLYRDVADFLTEQRAAGFKDCAAGSSATHQTTDADHGRVETRRHIGRSLLRPEITSDIGWLRQRHPAWPDLTSIAMPASPSSGRTPGAGQAGHPAHPLLHRLDRPRCHRVRACRSASTGASALGHQHWGIENGLHWVLDVVYREDECRIRKRNGPANFATIRHMTLNLLHRTKTAKRRAPASNEASPLSTKLFSKPS